MIKRSLGERIFEVLNIAMLLLLAISTFLPFWHLISVSLSEKHFVEAGLVTFWPKGMDFSAYINVLKDAKVVNSFLVTVFVTVMGTFISILLSVLMAYPLSKKDLVFRKLVMKMIIITMLFNGGMIPSYILIREIGLINKIWAMILPVSISAWNLIILKNFFQSIPESLEEAATIDGCSEVGILFKIVLPLSLPAIATISLFYAVPYWNTFMSAIMYINTASKYPLQVILRQFVIMGDVAGFDSAELKMPEQTMKAATIMVATVPILIVYPFIQKYFVKGVMIGAVKE